MNASSWIKDNLQQPNSLQPETLQSLGDFTLMWAIFEASEGEEQNNMLGQITIFANRLAEQVPIDLVDEEFLYWKDRYIKNGSPTDKFLHLRLSDERQNDLVLNTLTIVQPSLRDKLETCLLVVYRYRNNMFHGMKDIRTLNVQERNFRVAIALLQKVLPYGRAYWLGFPSI